MGTLTRVTGGLADARELFDLARAESDEDTLQGVSSDTEKLEKEVAALEFCIGRQLAQRDDARGAGIGHGLYTKSGPIRSRRNIE